MIREVKMSELLDHFGLEYTSRGNLLVCPFCGSKKSLHINDDKGVWICPKCKPRSSGKVLHFYARYVYGMDKLPESKKERGKLSKEMCERLGYPVSDDIHRPEPPMPKTNPNRVPAAPDAHLHAVYSAMAELPALQLSEAHRKELRKRGLSDVAIVRNGYRTMPDDFPNAAPYIDMYEKEGGDDTRRLVFDKWRYPAKYIQLGLMIAAALMSKGLDLKGVPGFYRFGNAWCFWVNPGIMIPTRNMKGQIVVWQVRRKVVRRDDPKYITDHCGSLPGAVTEGVCRCHFPLGNAAPSADAPCIFTEGPLKADVALDLYGKPATFAAIPGITVTADLLSYVEDLRTAGVTTMQNGFDMDKLTNPNVRQGSNDLMKELRLRGMVVQQRYWGERYARYKLTSLLHIAKLRNLTIPDISNLCVFDQLCKVADALDGANIVTCQFKPNNNGDKVSYYWEPETKGIDDYFLSIR